MALSLAKLTILVGAGVAGSVLAQEGGMSSISNFFSRAFKIVLKQVKQGDSTSSARRPKNDSLLAQVNNLREDMQILASNGPITIITSNRTGGASRYGIIIVVVVMGYGYIWWKGWKFPDMMFATRRSLSDAATSIAKQLESVHTSISATKRHLSSRIDRVDSSVDEFVELTAATEKEVSNLQERAQTIGADVNAVRYAVLTLETKINRIEEKQEFTNKGVYHLCNYAGNSDKSKSTEQIQGLPTGTSPALPLPPISSSSRVQRSLQNAVPDSGLKEFNEIVRRGESPSSPIGSNGIRASENTSNESSNSGIFGLRLPTINTSFLTRTRSTAN